MKATVAFFSSVQGDSVVCIDLMTVLPRSDYKQLHIRRARRREAFAMAREWGRKDPAAGLACKPNASIIRGKLDVLRGPLSCECTNRARFASAAGAASAARVIAADAVAAPAAAVHAICRE
jgi:hypothetical protein